jgi:hypothetical protein
MNQASITDISGIPASSPAAIAALFASADRLRDEHRESAALRAQVSERLAVARKRVDELSADLVETERPQVGPDRLSQLLSGTTTDVSEKELQTRAERMAKLKLLLNSANADVHLLHDEECSLADRIPHLEHDIEIADLECVRALEFALITRYHNAMGHLIADVIFPLRMVTRYLDEAGTAHGVRPRAKDLLGNLRVPAHAEGEAERVLMSDVTIWVNGGNLMPGNFPPRFGELWNAAPAAVVTELLDNFRKAVNQRASR